METYFFKQINLWASIIPAKCFMTLDTNPNKVILPTHLPEKSIIVLTIIYILIRSLPQLSSKLWSRSACLEASTALLSKLSPTFIRLDEIIQQFHHQIHINQMTSTNPKSTNLINREDVNEMIENAIRRHNRRSTIISAILGWILIGGYSFGLFHVVQNI